MLPRITTPRPDFDLTAFWFGACILSQSELQFDCVHFSAFGNFSLNFEVVYYVLSADYNLYMDKQQAINLAIFEESQKENIVFAYPTQKIFLDNGDKVIRGTSGETACSQSD